MAKLYFNLIESGNWTLEDVPEKWRAAVTSLMEGEKRA